MKEYSLSIIIPIYNVEKYIEECLNSVVSQITNLISIEIIVVNDGSPDNSINIVKNIQSKTSNVIKILNQNNQGLSMARNNGLSIAKGDYVWFIDSDDYILPNAITDILNIIDENPDIDVFASFLRHYYEDRKVFKDNIKPCRQKLSGFEYLCSKLPVGASPRFIFKRQFLKENNLRFVPKVLHEDAIFGFEMLYLAKKVFVIDHALYVYRIRTSGSIMSSIKIKTAYDLIYGHKYLSEFATHRVSAEDYNKYKEVILGVILTLLDFCKDLYGTNDYCEFLQCNSNSLYIKNEAKKVFRENKKNLKALTIAINPAIFIYALKVRRFFIDLLK